MSNTSTVEAVPHQRHGLAESLEIASLKVPFRIKVAAVWLVIGGLLLGGFFKSGFDIAWMVDHAFAIFKAVWVTIAFSIIAIACAVALALLGALGRVSRNPIAYGVSGFYTSFFRGTPLIVQLFLWYLALPQLALGLLPQQYATWFIWPAQVAGIVGIAFNYGAYMTEIFRAGIEAVPHGQAEAGAALGMSPGQQMRRIILPQATRIVIPPTGNEFIAMMKDTALIGLLGTTLLWADPFRMAQLSGKADFRNLEALIAAALVYWGLTAIFSFFQRKLEERMSKGYVRHGKGAS
ncbi:amino acid ABC transporter permease [Actinomycetes bacterium]|nr:amino acid ABC transporter permease [Actinomycetes bacterium]